MSEKASASTTVQSESISQGYEIVADLSNVSFSFRPDFREFGNAAIQAVADFKNGAEHTPVVEASNSLEVQSVYLNKVIDAKEAYVGRALAA